MIDDGIRRERKSRDVQIDLRGTWKGTYFSQRRCQVSSVTRTDGHTPLARGNAWEIKRCEPDRVITAYIQQTRHCRSHSTLQ